MSIVYYRTNFANSCSEIENSVKKPQLPLSWCRGQRQVYRELRLKLSGYKWLYYQDLQPGESFGSFCTASAKSSQKRYIRGCPAAIAAQLHKNGWQCIPNGSEAVLSLRGDHFSRRSLKELVRRGQRWGRMYEAALPDLDRTKFQLLCFQSRHGREPQLRYLFRQKPEEMQRCFVFEAEYGTWLAAVMLSTDGAGYFHTEVMLKSRHAPTGIMEALFHHIFLQLKKEGGDYLSLGEAPFFYIEKPAGVKANLLKWVGHSLRFAYNYHGLFRFKNKFEPLWQPVYLCGYPKISYSLLADLFWQTRLAHLTAYAAVRRAKHIFH